MSDARTLLVTTGDLPSLVLLALQPDPGAVVLWYPATAGEEPRAGTARRQAEIYGTAGFHEHPAPDDAGDGRDSQWGILLTCAAAAAPALGCTRLLWPAQVGAEARAVARCAEMGDLAVRLADLQRPDWSARAGDVGSPARITADCPLVDLTDAQIVDLADDRCVPMQAAWPCLAPGTDGEAPCGDCDECRRWRAAFTEVGLDWPWPASPGVVAQA